MSTATVINRLKELENEDLQGLKNSLWSGKYNLFLGAGVSLDAINAYGDPLPGGVEFKKELCELTGAKTSSGLQRVFQGLTPDQVKTYLTDRFIHCEPGKSVEKLPSFLWRRIFTLNIDDVVENVYWNQGGLQNLIAFHFKDPFDESRTLNDLPIVHLHGWTQKAEEGYVFSRTEYARVMAETNAWMTILADIMPVEPFIIAGTSMDEVDVEYYLAKRSAHSQRTDRGPSFLVEPNPDSQAKNDCERYGLTLYQGTFEDFLEELDSLLPSRVAAHELAPSEVKSLLPEKISKKLSLAFLSDFGRVPAEPNKSTDPMKFRYGHQPSWEDLAGHWDIGRAMSQRLESILEAMVDGSIPERIAVISENTGSGKSTVLRRVGFEFAKKGHIVLECTAHSRLDPLITAEVLDTIDQPLIVLVDNFGEQATAVGDLFGRMDRRDVCFVCAERNYRHRHIVHALGDTPYRIVRGLTLNYAEALQLVTSFDEMGLTSDKGASKDPQSFAKKIKDEPIAVACCHILKDLRPLDRIIDSTYQAAGQKERDRYLISTLAQVCFSGGVRYEILCSIVGSDRIEDQFQTAHPLPLALSYDSDGEFVVPLNATVGERTLSRAPVSDIYNAFVRLARGIAPRVNRNAIKRRSPEARLAGRLFDYEEVIGKFLGSHADQFYQEVHSAWRWNSRYWEQVALYQLAKFKETKDEWLLQKAVQHARHAVAVEYHPFPLTTLGKVIMAQMQLPGYNAAQVYAEAHEKLVEAVSAERRKGRASVHAYVTLFRGALEYADLGYYFTDVQVDSLRNLVSDAEKYFPRDNELRDLAERVKEEL